MTKIEIQTIKKIIEDLINITKNYDDGFDEKNLVVIDNFYNSSKCNITKLHYFEINNLIDQQITTFLINIEERQQVQEYIIEVSDKLSKLSKNNNFKELINYIGSYIENHIITYSSMLNVIQTTTEVQSDYNNKLISAKEDLIKAKDTIDNLLPNLLTVLSILISIVIAVVIVYITVFLNLENKPNSLIDEILQARFAQYVLSVHIVGDLFFIMMFMIARLTNRSILMTCSHFKWKPEIPDEHKDSYTTEFHRFACADCCTDCSFLKKLQRKSAYILYFNLLMFVLYAILYLWWILSYYIDSKNTFLFSSDFWFILFFSIIIIICVACFFLINFIKKQKENNQRIKNIANDAFVDIKRTYNDISLKKARSSKNLNNKYNIENGAPISPSTLGFDEKKEKISHIKYYIKKDFDEKEILLYDIKTKKNK